MTNKCPCTCLSCGILHWNSFRPASESVHDGEEVGIVFSNWERPDDVHVDAAEASVRRRDLDEWGMHMALNFGRLTSGALLAPTTNITLETMPYETRCDSLLCRFNARVGEILDSFKCLFGPCWRKEWSFFSSGDVAEDGGVA